MFSKELGKKLDKFHLLNHPFYQIYWNEGKLTSELIKNVSAFPLIPSVPKKRRFLSSLEPPKRCIALVAIAEFNKC